MKPSLPRGFAQISRPSSSLLRVARRRIFEFLLAFADDSPLTRVFARFLLIEDYNAAELYLRGNGGPGGLLFLKVSPLSSSVTLFVRSSRRGGISLDKPRLSGFRRQLDTTHRAY